MTRQLAYPAPKMTRQAFEAEFSADRGFLVSELRERGMMSGPCNCSEKDCPGWQALRLSLERAEAIAKVPGSVVKRFGERAQ